ncbi:MAG: beta-eliminating lyase-related protein, partial [Candidatus Dormiibacterota bacterium]
EDYLRYRVRSVEYMGEGFRAARIPIVEPPGGHAIFVDARAMLTHIPPGQLPAQSLACAFYREGGIRTVEVGTVMFGHTDAATGEQVPAPQDLLRLALPRRVYTQSHVDYVAEVAARVATHRDRLTGYRIVAEPATLRHFTATFEPIAG